MTVEDELSPDLIEAIQALEKLDDGELWRLAREVMPRTACQELEALHFNQRDEGLSPEEDASRVRLIHEYERVMLVRAKRPCSSRIEDMTSQEFSAIRAGRVGEGAVILLRQDPFCNGWWRKLSYELEWLVQRL